MGEALRSLIRDIPVLVELLAFEADEHHDPTASGLHRQLTDYKTVATINLLADVLALTNMISKMFQSRDACFSMLSDKVNYISI